jgi:MFS family permease
MRWYYGWNVLAVSVLFQAVLFGCTISSFTLLVPEWVTSFDAKVGQLQLVVLIYTAVQCMVAPLVGMHVDRTSIRNLIVAGAVMTAAGMFLLSLATATWQVLTIYGTLISTGLLLAGSLPAQTLAVKWFRGRRGFAIGLSTLGTSIGGVVLPLLVTKLFLAVGWREAHQIMAVLSLLAVVPVVWFFVRNSPEHMGIEPEPESQVSAARAAAQVFPQWTFAGLLRNRTFWIMVCAFVPMPFAGAAIQHNLRSIVGDAGISVIDAAFLVSVLSASMGVSKVLFGVIADWADLRYLFWLANFCLCAAIALFAIQPTYLVMVIASVLLGLGLGGFLPLLASVISTRFGPQSFGKVMSLMGPFTMLTGVGPWLAGYLRDFTGHYGANLNIFLLVLVPAMLAMALLKPPAAPSTRVLAPGE